MKRGLIGCFVPNFFSIEEKHLTKLRIARETTGRNYGHIYAYDKYLKILNEGAEPIT